MEPDSMAHELPPLLGRAEIVDVVVRRAAAGEGSIVLGPPGSGVSRALAETAAALTRTGVACRHVVVSKAMAATPYGVFHAMLDPATAAGIAAAAPLPRVALLRAAIEAMALRAIVLDGAAPFDPGSEALLQEHARAGVAVVAGGAAERDAPRALVTPSTTSPALAVHLPPLAQGDAGLLAEHLLGGRVDSELAGALTAASGGLPGPLIEAVEDGTSSGAIRFVDHHFRLIDPLPTPRSLRRRVAERFAELEPDVRGWVAAAAVAGEIADDLAARIACPPVLAAAAAGGWTTRDDVRGVTLARVPWEAAAVVDSLGEGARRAVLRRLLAAGDAVARPLTDGERLRAAGWRIELGERVGAEEAHELARMPEADDTTREQLLRIAVDGGAPAHAELAEHLQRRRRTSESSAVIEGAIEEGPPGQRAALARVLAFSRGLVERRSGPALASLDAHLARHGSDPELLAVRATLLLLEARPEEALVVALDVMGAPGVAGRLGRVIAAMCHRTLGRTGDAIALIAAAPGGAWVLADLQVDSAPELASALIETTPSEEITDRFGAPPLAAIRGRLAILRADPATAARLLQEADAGRGAWRHSCLPLLLADLLTAQCLAGRTEDAAETAARLRELQVQPNFEARARLALAQHAATRGDAATATRIAREAHDRALRSGLRADAFAAAYAGLRHGDDDAARRLLALDPAPDGHARDAQRAHALAVIGGDPVGYAAAARALRVAGLHLHAIEAAATASRLGHPVPELAVWLARAPDLRIRGVTTGRPDVLTDRERQVALLAARGHSDRAIATELDIRLRTAQTHLARAYAKLGVHRRTALASHLLEP